MSHDPSKIIYCCTKCGKLPCECVREYGKLDVMVFECKECNFIGMTMNQLQEHRLDRHERVKDYYDMLAIEGRVNGTGKVE